LLVVSFRSALFQLVTGCDNADLGALDNAAYIKEAQKASSTTVKVEGYSAYFS